MAPLKFTAEKTGSVTLYRGKASANAPFCDSSHAAAMTSCGALNPKTRNRWLM